MVAIRALHKTHSNRLSTNYILHPIFYKCYTQDSKPPPPVDHRASYKLFQDAAQEDAEEEEAKSRPSKLTLLEDQPENWTGEESVRDAVLRMLVDKYKPLRSGPIRTADEKLKQAPPKVGSFPSLAPHPSPPLNDSSEQGGIRPSGAAMAKVPLLPSIEGHQPWHTTFHVPSHATSSIKYGHIPKPSPSPYPPLSQRPSALSTLDEQARRREREAKKRSEHAGRLSRARESTLDYKLGSKSGVVSSIQRRPNPVSLKGWASLVEDRIEVSHCNQWYGLTL